jgi:hypothetical protein
MADAGERGILRGASPLEPTSSAKTVRVDRGKVMVTDGPFAETKEQLPATTSWIARISTRLLNGRPGLLPRAEAAQAVSISGPLMRSNWMFPALESSERNGTVIKRGVIPNVSPTRCTDAESQTVVWL